MSKFNNTLIKIIVTCFFVGRIKFAPGTFGSLLAFPLTYYTTLLTMQSDFRINLHGTATEGILFPTILTVLATLTLILFIIGIFCSSVYVKATGREDPKEVVIDEVVGQMITIIACAFSTVLVQNSKLVTVVDYSTINFCLFFLMPFTLFRIFDIFKPWPIDWIDRNVKGGLGIMLDDVLASIFAIVAHYIIIFVVIDWILPHMV